MKHAQKEATVFVLLSEVREALQAYTDNILTELKKQGTPTNQIKQIELALGGFRSAIDTTQGIIEKQIHQENLQ
jgi:hypothetical protein